MIRTSSKRCACSTSSSVETPAAAGCWPYIFCKLQELRPRNLAPTAWATYVAPRRGTESQRARPPRCEALPPKPTDLRVGQPIFGSTGAGSSSGPGPRLFCSLVAIVVVARRLTHQMLARRIAASSGSRSPSSSHAVGGASIFLALFSDRLEISSPGTWPPGFSREDFESGMSLRRNKAISRVLTRLEIIEGYGSGFDRITAECRAGGYPQPEWAENGPQIKVVLRPHPSSGPSTELGADTKRPSQQSSSARLTPQERHDIVLAAIDDLDRPSAADIQVHTGIAPRTLERDLRHLRSAGLVEFIGPRQRGFYRRIGKP
jgi:DNA-binding transcriptional ArsR family regulator